MGKYTVTITDLMGDNGKIEGIDPQEVDLEGMLKEWFPCAPGEEEDPQISECINKAVGWALSGNRALDIEGVLEAESYLGISLEMEEVRKPQGLQWFGLVSREKLEGLSRLSLPAALTNTGGMGVDTDIARLNYISLVRGRKVADALVEEGSFELDRREVKKAFEEAWLIGHERWVQLRASLLEGRALDARVIEALLKTMGTPYKVVNTRAGFDYVVQDGLRLEVKDQVCPEGQAVWQMWLAWFKTQAEQVGVNVEVVEENWDKEPVVFDADVSASQLATYALILQGRRFTLNPGLEIQDHVYCGVQEQIYY
jgi:hypothetical protein